MKRFLCMVFAFSVLLCGCGKKEIRPVLEGVNFKAQLLQNETQYIFSGKILKKELNICFTDPAPLGGVTAVITPNSSRLIFEEMEYKNGLMADSPAMLFYKVLSDIMQNEKSGIFDESNCVLKGELDSVSYIFCFAPSGLPISLEIPDENIKVNFSDVSIEKDC